MSVKVLSPHPSLEELKRRQLALRKAMKKAGFDCLLVVGYGWCVGYTRYLTDFVHHTNYVILPVEGEPSHFVWGGYHVEPQRLAGPIHDVERGRPDWGFKLAKKIKAYGLEKSKIGIAGVQCMPASHYLELKKELPNAEIGFATDLFEEAWSIKSPEEIAFMEKAAGILDQSFEAMYKAAQKRGASSEDVQRAIRTSITENGGMVDLILFAAGDDIWQQWMARKGAKVLQRGDVILNEIALSYGGYDVQGNRMISIGKPTRKYREAYELCLQLYRNGERLIKPGASLEEVGRKAYLEPLEEAGYDWTHPPTHGVGLAPPFAAEPFIPPHYERGDKYKPLPGAAYQPAKIKPGMTVVIQPQIHRKDRTAGAALGSTFVITETGNRCLSRLPMDLLVA